MAQISVPPHPLSAAVYYASLGWPVFPCNQRKRPKTANGFHGAHLDADRLKLNWVENPDDTIGIATGYGNGSRLLVVDLDSYKTEGHPEWDALAAENGQLPATFTVRTGQGGTQHYFLTPRVIRSSQPSTRGDNVQNVDIRCDGGYVIGAPSRTMYGAYTVLDDSVPVEAPEWVLQFAERTKATGERGPKDVAPYNPDAFTPQEKERLKTYVTNAVDGEVRRLRECREAAVANLHDYSGPPWDQTVFEVACNLVEFANSPWAPEFTEDDAHNLLLAEAPRDPDFSIATILSKWDSARKRVGDNGRNVPMNPTGEGYFVPFPGGDGGVIDPSVFFTKGEGLNTSLLMQAVLDMGPLAIEDTRERAIWSYNRGVWRHAPNEISDRVSVLLGPRFRTNHIATVLPPLQQKLNGDGHIITCDAVPEYINCRNGMLHWSTGKIYPHDPSLYSTVQLPVEWNPYAQCPQFDQFVKTIMPDDAYDYLWEVLGYMVYSGNPLQRAVLLHGGGANGKGTLIRILTGLLGKHNCSAVTLQDITEGKFEVASLFGKIANLAGDIDPTFMRSTAKFKAITGEDTVDAQRKFEHPFSFKCWATPLFSANEFWKSADTTTGYKRRWLLVPFPNMFEVTAGFSDSFGDENQGILRFAVAALQRLMQRGDFDPPESALAEKERFELAADQVAEWLIDDDNVQLADPKRQDVAYSAADAFRHYRNWAEQTNNQAISAQRFRQRLTSMGYIIRKSGEMKVLGFQYSLRTSNFSPNGAFASLN